MRLSRFAGLSLCACLAGCSNGGLPTSGRLPSLDGSSLTGVTADKVGTVSGDTVASTVGTVNGATSTGTPGSLVKYDGSGNFSAGAITATTFNGTLQGASSYGTGLQGTDLVSAAALPLPSGGNFFRVSGSNDIYTIGSGAQPGTRITLYFLGSLILHHNNPNGNSGAILRLQGLGNYKVTTGDLFELIFTGGEWREVSRTVSHDSDVYVGGLSGVTPTIPSVTLTPAVYLQSFIDNQIEYNSTTGVFTAKQAGLYQIFGSIAMVPPAANSAIWPAGAYCQILLVLRGNGVVSHLGAPASSTVSCFEFISIALTLNVGDTIAMQAYQNSGQSTLFYTFGYNYMRVTRVR